MKKNRKPKQYQFDKTITKQALKDFKNQYKKDEKFRKKLPEQEKNNNKICVDEYDIKLLTTLNQLETFFDKFDKEETSLIPTKEDEQLSKQTSKIKENKFKKEQI